MDYGKAVRKVRKDMRETQASFARKVGITATHLSLVESNDNTPSVKLLNAISRVSGVPVPMIIWAGLSEDDIDPRKVDFFRAIKPHVDGLIKEFS